MLCPCLFATNCHDRHQAVPLELLLLPIRVLPGNLALVWSYLAHAVVWSLEYWWCDRGLTCQAH